MNIRLILIAIAIGVLARVAYWCQLIFGVATGLASNSDPTAIQGPVMWFSCPPAPVLLLGLLVWICLVPFVEEVVHRGLIQSSLVHRGYWTAILVSALIFAAFHPPASMPLVFLFGVVFAFQFAHSGTLWSSIITHATYDGLIQIDWRCLHGMWNPPSDATPLISTAVLALTGLAMSGAGIVFLLLKTGAREAPRPAP